MSVNYDTMTIIGSVERDLKSFRYPIDLLKVVGKPKNIPQMICWSWFTMVERTKNHLKQTKGTGYKKQRFHSRKNSVSFNGMADLHPRIMHQTWIRSRMVCDEWPHYKHLNTVEVTKKDMEQKGINLQKLRGWGWRTQRIHAWYIYIPWMWPPPSNSDHQDYYIFSRGSL